MYFDLVVRLRTQLRTQTSLKQYGYYIFHFYRVSSKGELAVISEYVHPI